MTNKSFLSAKFSFLKTCSGAAIWILIIVGGTYALNNTKNKITTIESPNNRLKISFYLDTKNAPRYTIALDGKLVLLESKLGLIRNDADFTNNLEILTVSKPILITDRYEILTAKRRNNIYSANRIVFLLQTTAKKKIEIIFQVSNDGVALRYHFPEKDDTNYQISDEQTSFRFPSEAKAWLQPMAVAHTGWKESQPSYEEYYEKEVPVGTPSTLGAGWVYPALFRSENIWILISESGMERNYCGTRLRHESPNGEYQIGFPNPKENKDGGAVNPESKLPWFSPWRVIAIGDLATVADSMLGVDVAAKPAIGSSSQIEPGKSSWSWVLLGDKQTNYETQKRFIDYAADMKWQYCLIDALWDTQIGYEKVKELTDYARSKNVKILLWYNSAGDWNSTPQTPRNLMLTRESRLREFDRLKTIGVAGLKIDFFGGDGQSFINYYMDILQDAAKYNLAINFHGATLPRGMQRTFPNLMTMEAIRGMEFITFEQKNADEEPTHAAMLPFTRNVFDPMDFTPMALDRVNSRITRRTTSGFELALSILFTSGIQHYAETPEGMAKVPPYVKDFLKNVPNVWENTKFLDGYPGKFAVLARKGDNRWYVSGINAENVEKKLTLDLGKLKIGKTINLITDGNEHNMSFRQEKIELNPNGKLEITIMPHGGFVLLSK